MKDENFGIIKAIDNYIADYERQIAEEREARKDSEQQPEDDSSGTVDIQPTENQDTQSEEEVVNQNHTDESS